MARGRRRHMPVAIVTGSDSGIGKATAVAVAQDGFDVGGAFGCGQRAARAMVDRGTAGRIINVTSVHEHVPLEGSAAYCAAKGGLGLLTKVMALELARHGITVNSVAPGEISTPMTG